jgi:hypothetical protein
VEFVHKNKPNDVVEDFLGPDIKVSKFKREYSIYNVVNVASKMEGDMQTHILFSATKFCFLHSLFAL